MSNNYRDITLALAGVCQGTKLVQGLAESGHLEQKAFETMIKSLLVTNPSSALDVYGNNIDNLWLGVETLLSELNGRHSAHTKYWLSILRLSNLLAKNPSAREELARRIQRVPEQLAHYDLFSSQMIGNFASMYGDIISPLGKKIIIQGKLDYLEPTDVQDKLRACLLASLRSAVLWQQVGGTKWQLLFSRGKIFSQAKQLFDSIYPME